MLDDLGDRIEDAAESIGARLLRILGGLVVLGWSGFWAFLLLLGYLFTAPVLMGVSGAALVLGIVTVLVRGAMRKNRLARRAEHELVARAKLEGVKLDRNITAVLEAFDVTYNQVRRQLEQQKTLEETVVVDANLDLERVRERMFDTAVTKSELVRDARRLSRSSSSAVVRTSLDDAKAAVAEQQREAERITAEVQQLYDRLDQVRQASGDNAARDKSRLEQILTDLDTTARAYAEIEAAETDEERKLRALRAARTQKTRR